MEVCLLFRNFAGMNDIVTLFHGSNVVVERIIFNENKIIYMKSSKSIEYSLIIERRNLNAT